MGVGLVFIRRKQCQAAARILLNTMAALVCFSKAVLLVARPCTQEYFSTYNMALGSLSSLKLTAAKDKIRAVIMSRSDIGW